MLVTVGNVDAVLKFSLCINAVVFITRPDGVFARQQILCNMCLVSLNLAALTQYDYMLKLNDG